jgi:Tol biopolymer transport system component
MKYAWLAALAAVAVLVPAGAQTAPKLIDCTCYDLFLVSPSGRGEGHLLSRGGGRNLFDVSADRRKILYSTRIWELHASSVRGRYKRLLAKSSTFEIRNARWSPNGKWVFYESDSAACSGEGTEARVVDRDGDGDHAIGCSAYLIAWGSDSRRVAYGQYVAPGRPNNGGMRLIVANRDGSGQHVVTEQPYITQVQWSPRGDWIAYAALNHAGASIHLVRPDGSRDVRIARGAVATWAPGGRRLAVEWSPRNAPGTRLSVLNVDTRRVRILDRRTTDPYRQGVGWSPDGRSIVYRRVAKPKCDVCRMALYTTPISKPHARRILTGDPREEFGPLYWLPNGKQILYTSYVQEGV